VAAAFVETLADAAALGSHIVCHMVDALGLALAAGRGRAAALAVCPLTKK
jgi:hypothetical protein